MNSIRRYLIFIGFLIVILLSACKSEMKENNSEPIKEVIQDNQVNENKSKVTAEVLQITNSSENDFLIEMKILSAEKVKDLANYAKSDSIISVKPFYQVKEGDLEVNFADEHNKQLKEAALLSKGDTISAVVSFSGGKLQNWFLYDWNKSN